MMNTTTGARLNSLWWIMRIGFGLAPLLAGLDKFFNLLTTWEMYLSPMAESFLPFDAALFMRIVGVIEMVVGLAILTRWTRLGSYVAAIWLVLISLNLISTGMFLDLAVRDLELALAAYALAKITEIRAGLRVRDGELSSREPVIEEFSPPRMQSAQR